MRWTSALVAITVLACGGGDRSSATADTAVVQSKSPPIDTSSIGGVGADTGHATDSATVTGPTLVLIADSAAGEMIFRRQGKCLACHGAAGAGLPGLGTNLQDVEWLHGDGSFAFIARTIRDGIARPAVAPIAMPASATTLTADEINKVAAYVYALSHPGMVVPDTIAR